MSWPTLRCIAPVQLGTNHFWIISWARWQNRNGDSDRVLQALLPVLKVYEPVRLVKGLQLLALDVKTYYWKKHGWCSLRKDIFESLLSSRAFNRLAQNEADGGLKRTGLFMFTRWIRYRFTANIYMLLLSRKVLFVGLDFDPVAFKYVERFN